MPYKGIEMQSDQYQLLIAYFTATSAQVAALFTYVLVLVVTCLWHVTYHDVVLYYLPRKTANLRKHHAIFVNPGKMGNLSLRSQIRSPS